MARKSWQTISFYVRGRLISEQFSAPALGSNVRILDLADVSVEALGFMVRYVIPEISTGQAAHP